MIVLCAWNYFVVSYVALKRLLVLIAGVWSFVNKQDQNLKKKMYIPLFYIALLRLITLHTNGSMETNFISPTSKEYILFQPGEIQRKFPSLECMHCFIQVDISYKCYDNYTFFWRQLVLDSIKNLLFWVIQMILNNVL